MSTATVSAKAWIVMKDTHAQEVRLDRQSAMDERDRRNADAAERHARYPGQHLERWYVQEVPLVQALVTISMKMEFKHRLLTPKTCLCNKMSDARDCPTCDKGLSVCAVCGAAESELAEPCPGERTIVSLRCGDCRFKASTPFHASGDRCPNPFLPNGCDGVLAVAMEPDAPGYVVAAMTGRLLRRR